MSDLGITVLVSTLTILLFLGLVVLLLVLNNSRRHRHRAQLAELRAEHAGEMLNVEREVQAQTLGEVASELHDSVGQLLSVVRLGIVRELAGRPGDAQLTSLKSDMDHTITEVRRMSHLLDPGRWENTRLTTMIERECERVRRTGSQQMDLIASGQEPALSAQTKLVLFRVFQEALANAIKHAEAKVITVRLAADEGVLLSISDDGRGFDPQQAGDTGMGLSNMRRRASLVGYHCMVESHPGKGTTIHIAPQ